MPYTDYYRDIMSGDMKGIYAFYGPEKFIINSMIDISKKKFITEGLESVDLIDFDAKGLAYTEAKQMLEHLPFGSEKRLIIMRNPDFLESEKWKRENLDHFLELHKSSEYLLTLLILDKIDNRKYGPKALAKVGKIVEFSKIDREELSRWIQNKFNELNRSIDKAAITYIADNSLYLEKNDEDLGALYSFIQVLSDSVKTDPIRVSDVKSKLEIKLESDVFKWRTALLMGRAKDSIYYLHALLAEEEPPIKLLYMLESHIKDFYLFYLLKSAKLGDGEIAKRMGKQVFMLRDYNAFFNSGLHKHLNHIMTLVLDCDDRMKIGGINGTLLLQDLAFRMEEIRKIK